MGDCMANFVTVPIMSSNRLWRWWYRFTLLSLMRPFTIMTGMRMRRQARRKFGHSSVSTGKKTRGVIRRTI